ncbi:hypothetical protein, partial [Nonomuraea basaltis]|uniref:hypothetical protein n=1 Tax=Nonomuraea basaltis TaxID=2495887 RepID=UPI0019818E44
MDPQLRIPPTVEEIEQLFVGWREELLSCRKFAPAARNYAVARLVADVGLRIDEARMLDLEDVRWELGRFGKLNVSSPHPWARQRSQTMTTVYRWPAGRWVGSSFGVGPPRSRRSHMPVRLSGATSTGVGQRDHRLEQ